MLEVIIEGDTTVHVEETGSVGDMALAAAALAGRHVENATLKINGRVADPTHPYVSPADPDVAGYRAELIELTADAYAMLTGHASPDVDTEDVDE